MGPLRTLISDRRRLAMLLVALAIAMKAMVPAGYMLGQMPGVKVLTIEVCSDVQGGTFTQKIVVPHSGKPHGDASQDKDGTACPYSALSMASLGGADAVLLALALTFILATGFAQAPPLRLERVLHLRPPLRGPPVRI